MQQKYLWIKRLAHVLEKWVAVFRRGRAPMKIWSASRFDDRDTLRESGARALRTGMLEICSGTASCIVAA
jgi:hypothetical protein